MKYFSIVILFFCFYNCNAMQRDSQATAATTFKNLSDAQKEERAALGFFYAAHYSSGAFYSPNPPDGNKKDIKTIVSPYNFQNDWLR